MDTDTKLSALKVAAQTHGQTIVQADLEGGVTIERPEVGAVVAAAAAYTAFLEPPDDGPPPLVHPERAVLMKLYGIGQAMYEARAATGDESLIRALESLRDVGPAVHPLVALQLADLVDVLRWALNEAEPF